MKHKTPCASISALNYQRISLCEGKIKELTKIKVEILKANQMKFCSAEDTTKN
jgi:hypothetical protein